MYRQLLAVLLMLAFTVQTFNQGLIVFGFYANQDAIAKKLCVNRARPKMHCNGKCQLMKKMQEEEKKDQENSTRKIENKTDIVFTQASYASIHHEIDQVTSPGFLLYNEPLVGSFWVDIFHPPQLL